MADTDNSRSMLTYIDPHLGLHVIDFLIKQNIYKKSDMLKAKYQLLQNTHMVESLTQVYQEMNDTKEVPKSIQNQKTEVLASYKELKAAADPFLEQKSEVAGRDPKPVYDYGLFLYKIGHYKDALRVLNTFTEAPTATEKQIFQAQWGILSSMILTADAENAAVTLANLVKNIGDRKSNSPVLTLQQRMWALHWSLFIFFKVLGDCSELSELFNGDGMLNGVSVAAPHLVRYLAAAVILHPEGPRPGKWALNQAVHFIRATNKTYMDPLTSFLLHVYEDFDFEKARENLVKLDHLLSNDYFLCDMKDDIMKRARALMFETYVRIHTSCGLDKLCKLLDLSLEEKSAEEHLLDLCVSTHLQTRIDSKTNELRMRKDVSTVHKTVFEKSKQLLFRSKKIVESIPSND